MTGWSSRAQRNRGRGTASAVTTGEKLPTQCDSSEGLLEFMKEKKKIESHCLEIAETLGPKNQELLSWDSGCRFCRRLMTGLWLLFLPDQVNVQWSGINPDSGRVEQSFPRLWKQYPRRWPGPPFLMELLFDSVRLFCVRDGDSFTSTWGSQLQLSPGCIPCPLGHVAKLNAVVMVSIAVAQPKSLFHGDRNFGRLKFRTVRTCLKVFAQGETQNRNRWTGAHATSCRPRQTNFPHKPVYEYSTSELGDWNLKGSKFIRLDGFVKTRRHPVQKCQVFTRWLFSTSLWLEYILWLAELRCS